MDTFRSQGASLTSPAAMTERVILDARRAFGAADAALVEQSAREAVAELWADGIRVKTFVPVLAMRRVREAVEAGGNGGARPDGA